MAKLFIFKAELIKKDGNTYIACELCQGDPMKARMSFKKNVFDGTTTDNMIFKRLKNLIKSKGEDGKWDDETLENCHVEEGIAMRIAMPSHYRWRNKNGKPTKYTGDDERVITFCKFCAFGDQTDFDNEVQAYKNRTTAAGAWIDDDEGGEEEED